MDITRSSQTCKAYKFNDMDSKELTLPYVEGLGKAEGLQEFAELLREAADMTGCGRACVDNVDWPDSFPYAPECNVIAGWCKKGIGILFNVKGLDLRAQAEEDNRRVCEDSCCEFFISDPKDGTYYNFEMNCIGTMLAGKRKTRNDYIHFTEDKLRQIHRFTSLDWKAYDISDKEFSWSVGMLIPFSLMGIDPVDRPLSLRANFYKCGDLTAHPHYLSWAPVRTENPDFHRPEFFGRLTLAPAPVSMMRKLFPFLLALYFACVGFLCFWHFDNLQDATQYIFGIPTDKIVHFCIFFPFPILSYATFGRKTKGKWKSVMFILGIFLAGCILGGATELGQGLTTYRSCDINDFRADALGMAISSVIVLVIDAIRHSK